MGLSINKTTYVISGRENTVMASTSQLITLVISIR